MTLPTTHPEIAALWHAKNAKHPEQVTHGSHDNVWWQCPTHKSHVFLMRVDARCLAIYPCSICAEAAGKGGRHGATKAAPVVSRRQISLSKLVASILGDRLAPSRSHLARSANKWGLANSLGSWRLGAPRGAH